MTAHAYHATLAEHLPAIVAEGLTPNDGSRGIWPDEYDVVGRLFMCSDLDGARHYAETMADATGEETEVLRFPMPVKRKRDRMTDFAGAWHTAETVPPDVIEILDGDDWKPLRGDAP